jgi:hypothetical protein
MTKSLYSIHPSYAMEEGYAANLEERTGKTIDEWVEVVRRYGPPTEKERRAWLKDAHGLTTNYAWWVAERAEGRMGGAENYDPEGLVEAMFAAGKAGLRPLYDELLKLGLGLGPDVKACPCKTIVPLYRKNVFAELKPSTRTRLDLGLCLRGEPFTDRLLDTGGQAKGDRITHRVAVTCAEDVDAELKRWLRLAYEKAGDEPAKGEGKKKAADPVTVPDDLAKALAVSPAAQAAFAALPPSHQREHVRAVEEAKKPETRARRVAKAVELLAKGPRK